MMEFIRPSVRSHAWATKYQYLIYGMVKQDKMKSMRFRIGIPAAIADQAGIETGQVGIVGFDADTLRCRVEQVGEDGYTFRRSSYKNPHRKPGGRIYILVPPFGDMKTSLSGRVSASEIQIEPEAIEFRLGAS